VRTANPRRPAVRALHSTWHRIAGRGLSVARAQAAAGRYTVMTARGLPAPQPGIS